MSPITVNSKISINEETLAIFDEERQICVFLNILEGSYIEVKDLSLRVMGTIYKHKCATVNLVSEELAVDVTNVLDVVRILLDQGLLMSIYNDNASLKSTSEHNPQLYSQLKGFTTSDSRNYPDIYLILEYALLIPWWKLQLRFRGWTIVRKILNEQGLTRVNTTSHEPLQIVEEVISAIRLACIFPWVSRSCIPNSLAIYSILKKRNYLPVLVLGSDVVPFEPHMWVSLNGYRIDSGADEQSLLIFQPISFVFTHLINCSYL